jgi:hypothetical protein
MLEILINKIIINIEEIKIIIKDTYPISTPRQAESLRFVDFQPYDTWKLKM